MKERKPYVRRKPYKKKQSEEFKYLKLLSDFVELAKKDDDSKGCYRMLGGHLRFDTTRYFPIMTTCWTNINDVCVEVAWLLNGANNTKLLRMYGWDVDFHSGASEPFQLRRFNGFFDQLKYAMKCFENDKPSVIQLWNIEDISKGRSRIEPKASSMQFSRSGHEFHTFVNIPIIDIIRELPYFIAMYSVFHKIFASHYKLKAKSISFNITEIGCDLSDYTLCKKVSTLEPIGVPIIRYNGDNIFNYCSEDIELCSYDAHNILKNPKICASVNMRQVEKESFFYANWRKNYCK